jgi:hypothetical protein
MLERLPPVAARNARESGTDVAGYLTGSPGASTLPLTLTGADQVSPPSVDWVNSMSMFVPFHVSQAA